MSSNVCGAVSKIQKMATHAVRCPCFSHALNLSLARSSSVQCVRNSVGIIKDVVSFLMLARSEIAHWNELQEKKLQSLCETRWVERHDAICETRWVERHDAILLLCSDRASLHCEVINGNHKLDWKCFSEQGSDKRVGGWVMSWAVRISCVNFEKLMDLRQRKEKEFSQRRRWKRSYS